MIIIGGGLAGGTAAWHLARGGAAVTLIERTTEPHDKVCGEFLSGEALGELRSMGIEPRDHGAASLTRVRTAARGDASAAPLPFEAVSLSRRILDELVLQRAAEAGADILRGVTVRAATPDSVLLRDGDSIHAPAVIVATGKHDLSQHKRPPGRHDGMVGIKTYLAVRPSVMADLRSTVDVVFFPGGYIGFQEVEGSRINACLAAEQWALSEAGGDPTALLRRVAQQSEHAHRIFADCSFLLEKPLAVGRIPYGLVRSRTDGLYYIGDQAAVIPSFCGEGMGLALRSGRLVAEAVLSGRSATDFQSSFARLAGRRVKAAATLSAILAKPSAQRLAAGLAGAAPFLVTALAAATRTPPTPQASGHVLAQ
ncbi:NAD(P)/FAD-dependent oxidoreductase [Parvularcula maris]|uniref:FAD-dependent oxidoreductase n=1 Tax=Parvularcula maris TaxID=2965077 RepID=A0A9X2L835_9PROT|nr:FAD-dependent oxidoreductase [Parvularcula maris]MCQ8184674.1 FAD-dependent oxidoreductase [Parvularcula maris]